jgi:uncharacterized protein
MAKVLKRPKFSFILKQMFMTKDANSQWPIAKGQSSLRFVLDVHLGKLARLLRMSGFDCFYRNDLDDPEIISIAQEQERIVLTRDRGILRNKKVSHGHFVQSTEPKEQLKEIIEVFGLRDQFKPLSRCMVCNGNIGKVDKQQIESLLLPGTRKHFEEFFRCGQCSKIYWKGSHYDKMVSLLKNI